MTQKIHYISILLALIVCQGCYAPEHTMKFEWPWDKKDPKATPKADEPKSTFVASKNSDKTAEELELEKANQITTTTPPPSAVSADKIEQHRQEIYPVIKRLRDSKESDDHKIQLASVIGNMEKWYAILPEDPPEADSADLISIMIWDFTPEKDFQKHSQTWKQLAVKQKIPFEEPLTRRKLHLLIKKIIRGS